MNKYLKIGLWAALAGLIIGLSTVYYIFNMPHRNLENEKPDFTLTAQELYNDFSADETAGNLKYGDKAIQVSGVVIEKTVHENDATIVLNDAMEGISCSFDSLYLVNNNEKIVKIELGETITVKGKCDGIDMIMGVVLTKCVLTDDK